MATQAPSKSCGRLANHFWVMTNPPQICPGDSSFYCRCSVCGEKRWIVLSKGEFKKVFELVQAKTLPDGFRIMPKQLVPA
ncbi:MAG: hypothetical protein NT026_01370 [Candidatus Staskawiczbacteria bacterium]|nr:hypothetical protein [Candidatus Staskawiczbacteria bacterium]